MRPFQHVSLLTAAVSLVVGINVSATWGADPAESRSDEAIFNILNRVGTAYTAGFTCEGTAIVDNSANATPEPKTQWNYTRENARRAFMRSPLSVAPPNLDQLRKQQKLLQSRQSKRSGDEEHSFNTLAAETFLYDGKLSATVRRLAVFTSTDLKHFEPYGETCVVETYHGDSRALSTSFQTIEIASGRGIHHYIKDVGATEELPEGLISAEARGFGVDGQPGRWTLVLEPKLEYLVRRARFRPDEGKQIVIEMTNTGSLKDGACIVAETAVYTLDLGTSKRATTISFSKARLEFDSAILSQAQSALEGPFPRGSRVTDYRVSPAKVEVVGYKSGQRAQKYVDTKTATRKPPWLWIVINGIIFIVVLAVVLKRYFASESAP